MTQVFEFGKCRRHNRGLWRMCALGCALAITWAIATALLDISPLKAVVAGTAATRRDGTQLHGQRNTLARHVNLHYLHLDNVTGLDYLTGIGDKLVAELAHMHQPVLVHTQVNKGTEGGHVADRAF